MDYSNKLTTTVVVLDKNELIVDIALVHDIPSIIIGTPWQGGVDDDYITETIELNQQTLKLIRRKPYDALTGAQPRARFEQDLGELYALSEKNFGLALCDINHLKKVNDAKGHLAGDALLKEFVCKIKSVFRQYDSVYRYGGDEFTIIFRQISRAQLIDVILPRLRQAAHAISACGTAHAIEATSANELIELADARLYADKKDYL